MFCPQIVFVYSSEFADTILSVHPSDVLDMPVDPNEPTYCLCHQVSYGEMIGCDNPDVSTWFVVKRCSVSSEMMIATS